MTTERFSNQASTTLASSVGSGDLSISVQGTAHFPTQPEFRIRIGQELMLVSGVSGTTWTVTRGIEGTSASSHAAGTAVVAVLTAGALDELRAEINIIWFGPPVDGITDDWTALNVAVQAAPSGSIVRLRPSSLPYINDHSVVNGKNGVTLHIPDGVTVKSYTNYSGPLGMILYYPPEQFTGFPNIFTINGAVDKGATQITVSWLGADRLVAGDTFCINATMVGRVPFRAVQVVGNVITLDLPTWFPIDSGCGAWKYTLVHAFHVLLDGLIEEHLDGVWGDHRVIMMGVAWNCSVTGTGEVRQVEGQGLTALVGFDMGGRNNLVEGITITGMSGSDGLTSGYAFEGQRSSRSRNVKINKCGYGMWLSASSYCEIQHQAENCLGMVFHTENTFWGPAGEFGSHYNTLNIKQNSMVAGGYGMFLGGDFSDNIVDLCVDGGAAQVAGTVIYLGTNGTIGCNNNHFRTVKVNNVSTLILCGTAGTGNVFGEVRIDGVQTIVSAVNPGSSMVIESIVGTILTTDGGQLGISQGNELIVNHGRLHITRVTGTIFSYFSGKITLRNFEVTHSGSGYEYGFLNGGPTAKLILENVDMGTWGTAFISLSLESSVTMLGYCRYTGSVSGPFINRVQMTLNGSTPVFKPIPDINSTSMPNLVRIGAGGTSHGVPLYSAVNNTTSIVGTDNGWMSGGLASWDGTVMTADANDSVHYLQYVIGTGYVRGPAIFRTTVKPTGAATWIALSLGDNLLYFNLATGALGTSSGLGVTGYGVVNGDGSTTVVMYADDFHYVAANVYIWMISADGVLSSSMPGATFTLSNLSITGINAVSLEAEVGNNDVYSVAVQ